MMTRAEAAKWCRVSLAAFDAHIRPNLPVKRVGRRVLVHRSDLEAWAHAEEVKKQAEPSGANQWKRSPSGRGPLLEMLLARPEAAALRERPNAASTTNLRAALESCGG